MRKYHLLTFGCAMNIADSEKIDLILYQSGFSKTSIWKESDIIIFNTCSVRQKGEDKVLGLIEEINKEKIKSKKDIKVFITGCMVRKTGLDQKYLDNKSRDRNKSKIITPLSNSKEIFNSDDKLFPRTNGKIDAVFRIEDIKCIPHILSHIFKENIGLEYKFDDYLKAKSLRENPFSVPIIIQTGCDNFCSYCIVPYTRGRELSRDKNDIINEVKEAVQNGAKEITLIGQNVNSYGKQFLNKKFWNEEKGKWNSGIGKSPFRELLEELDKIEGLKRIRFTSSNPHDMTEDILNSFFELNKVCHHLHFALQSGNNEMLKKMNRRHTYEDFKNMVLFLREKDPNFGISTDLIAGFSGETEEMFNDTLKSFNELEFDFSYNSRYSVRKGTIASKSYIDDVSNEIKSDRWHKLNNKLLDTITKRNKMILGKIEEILVFAKKDNLCQGRTKNFKQVFFEGKNINIGDIVNVQITDLDKYVLKGKII